MTGISDQHMFSQGCPIMLLEAHLPAEFSSNLEVSHYPEDLD